MESGSLQSSSGGGDDEFTSCAAAPNSLSSLFDPNYFIDTSSPKPDFSSLLFDPFSPVPDPPTAPTVPAPIPNPSPPRQLRNNNNPRKRSRASRRAPTTVLTTDTNNFRAMVQEFTGIPAPPFQSSPFIRPRLDLYAGGSSGPDALLLRPFAHKFQPQQLPNGYQSQSQGLTSLRNDPVLTFQSLLNQPRNASQGGNMPNLVPSEGNLDVLQEKGTKAQNVMEQWLCSSVNR